MKQITIVIIILFVDFSIAISQTYELHPATDVYGMYVKFKKMIMIGKKDCCCFIYPKTKNCTLYEVEIKEVFLQRDSSVYQNGEELKLVSYMIMPNTIKNEDIVFSSVYTVFAFNSCSEKMLRINQLLDHRPDPMPDFTGLAFVVGLGICKDYTIFQKLFLALRINREKIYEKAKDMPPEKSKFVEAILKEEGKL